MKESIISLQDVIIKRKHDNVLQNLHLEISAGEFCFLVGRTGSGKSSLIKALYAQIPIYSGRARVCGFDLTKLRRKDKTDLRRSIGMVFQDFRLFGDWTVRQNLDFVLKVTGWRSSKKRLERIIEVLSDVGLATKLSSKVAHLSGGEQQRLSIGRAILNHPKLIIADEPTGNLDPQTADEIIYLLSNINAHQHTGILLATHEYRIIEKFPNRIIRCENRQLQEVNYESIQ